MESRVSKQVFFLIIYAVLFALVVWGAYLIFKPDATCFDNKKNQSEEETDCGGPCKSCEINKLSPLQIQNSEAVFIADNSVSLAARVTNSNIRYGARSFDYTWNVIDRNGTVARTEVGKSYIYPSETKYVILPTLNVPFSSIGSVDLIIENIDWRSIDEFPKPNIVIREMRTEVSGDKVVTNGAFVNNEAYKLIKADITGVLFDNSGKVIAVSYSNYSGVEAFAARFFQVTFSPSVDSVSAVDTNRTQIFIETILPR